MTNYYYYISKTKISRNNFGIVIRVGRKSRTKAFKTILIHYLVLIHKPCFIILYKIIRILKPRKGENIFSRWFYIVWHHNSRKSLVRDLWPTLYFNVIKIKFLLNNLFSDGNRKKSSFKAYINYGVLQLLTQVSCFCNVRIKSWNKTLKIRSYWTTRWR